MAEGKLILEPGESATTSRKPSGYILADGEEIAQTLQCGHCHKHCISVKGSGVLRGYCTKCDSWLCGAPACIAKCYPFEKRMEDFENGKISVLR